MSHVSHVDLKEGQTPRRFASSPLHLFWGASEQNQRTYYISKMSFQLKTV